MSQISDKWRWKDPEKPGELPDGRVSGSSCWPLYDSVDQAYDPDAADIFLKRVLRGERVADICASEDMPNCRDIYRWRMEQPEFAAQWKQNRKAGGFNRKQHTHEQRLEIVEEILTEYSEGDRTLREILSDSEDYPRTGVLMRWRNEIPEVQEMWEAADESRAIMMMEDALKLVNEADGDDPRVLKLRIDTRRWLAERFYRAKFGAQQTVINQGDDLLRKTSDELENTLRGVLKEMDELGLQVGQH